MNARKTNTKLLTFIKLSRLIGSEVYSTVTYFRKTNLLETVTTGEWAVVTKNIKNDKNNKKHSKQKQKETKTTRGTEKISQTCDVLACFYMVRIVLNIKAPPTQIWIFLKLHCFTRTCLQ